MATGTAVTQLSERRGQENRQCVNSPSSGTLKTAANPQWFEAVSEMVTQCHHALRGYGKTPEQITASVKIFSLVLAKYPIDDIRAAFVAYLENHAEIPTPADIVGYIRREGHKPMDKALYIALCQKRQQTSWSEGPNPWQKGDGLNNAEAKYIRDYERLEGLDDV